MGKLKKEKIRAILSEKRKERKMDTDKETIIQLLEDLGQDNVEDVSLDTPLTEIADLSVIQDTLDFEFGVTPPITDMEKYTVRDLIEFYKG